MLNIGKEIYSRVKDFVQGRCYPLVAEQGTRFPFMIYQSQSDRPETTKDGIYEWDHTVVLRIASDKYDEVCALTDQVAPLLYEDGDDINILVESISEDYVDDAFVKTLTVSVKTV